MKTILKTTLLAGIVLLNIPVSAQSSNDGQVEKPVVQKHLKMVKVENGVVTELDTMITGDEELVWDGDSVMKREMKNFRFAKHHKGHRPPMGKFDKEDFKEFRKMKRVDGDSTCHMAMQHRGNGKGELKRPGRPDMPQSPRAMHRIHKKRMANPDLINLNDPGVISFKKKTMKNGIEKIEIVRQKPVEKQIELETEVTIENESSN
ncbi:hypothetical protein [Mangrovibacterium sp.]|uniref:hypothetical protein n=1 Tax=Mangrovibacterium sp. TaxID=1961364 RepID=UPI003563B00A